MVPEESRADDGNIRQQRNDSYVSRRQPRIAARELEMVKQCRQAFETERQRDADDDLVQPYAHAKQRHDQRHRDAAGGTGEEAQPERSRIESAEETEIGAGQHHAFDADVEHTGLFRHLFAKPGKQQRNGGRDGAEQQCA